MQLKNNVIAIVPDLVILNEIIPMGYYLGRNFYIIDIFNLIRNSDYSKEVISNCNIIIPDQNYSLKFKFFSFIEKIISKIRIKNEYFTALVHRIRTEEITKNFLKEILPLNKRHSFRSLLIRAGNDLLIRSLILNFKKNGFKGRVIGISQAIPALSNIVHNKNYIHDPNENMYFDKKYSLVHECDEIVVNSNTTLGQYRKIGISFENKIKFIKSLRNTREWYKLMKKYTTLSKRTSKKKRLLFLHSNFNSNINKDEVRRSIKIVESNKKLKIGFRPHIRYGKIINNSEMKYLFKGIKKYRVFRESLNEAILWSDICIFYGSSASIDALSFEKPTIFLRYATANTLDEDLKKYLIFCDNPHEFILECKKLNKFAIIKNNKKKYPLSSTKYLVSEWIKYLS